MLKILWLLLTFSHSKNCNGDGDDQEWYIIYRILVLSGKTLYILNISNSKYDISYMLWVMMIFCRVQLEDLSRQMHDEVNTKSDHTLWSSIPSWNISSLSNILLQVSETENIRKNLAIERMIVEGCDILLDVNQVFVRQGTLIQVQQCSWNQIISVMLICEDDDDYNECWMAGSARQSPWRSSGSSLCSSPWKVSDVDNYRDNADHEDRDNHPDNPDCFLLWAGKPSASASYSATT